MSNYIAMSNDEKKNIYNAIQNLYNMDFTSWQEVLAMMYNLVSDTTQKFDVFEQRFIILLGQEVAKSIRELHINGQLADIIDTELFGNLKSKIETIDNAKFDKTGIITMGNLGQDVKEAMVNGSVAVVGKYSVGHDNYKYNSLDVDRTKFIRCGANILNSNDLIMGYLTNKGGIYPTSTYYTTHIKPTYGEKFITLARRNADNSTLNQPRNIRFVCFYDSALNVMESNFYENSNGVNESVSIPENAVYFSLSFQSGYNDGRSMIYLGKSGKYSFYEPYEEIIENLSLNNKSIKQMKASVKKDLLNNKYISPENVTFLEKIGDNLWNTEIFEVGYIDINDKMVDDSNYHTSPHILIKDFSLSAFRYNTGNAEQTYIRIINYYDENLEVIKSLRYDNSKRVIETIAIPRNAVYMRIVIDRHFSNDIMIVYGSVAPTAYQPYKFRLKNIEMNVYSSSVKVESILKEKILFNFGDSIGAGDGNKGKGYAEILGEMYGMTVYDFAVGGATLGDTASNNITTQVEKAISTNIKPHYILIEGGTNDITPQMNVPLGVITDDFSISNFNRTTTTGGLEYCLYKLKQAYPDAKIVFVSVHKMGSRSFYSQVERQKACIQVSEKWGIPIADIGNRGNLNTFLSCMHKYSNPTSSQPNGDRTHPNDLGYRTFYIPIIYNVLISI